MKRVALNTEELALIARLREDRAIYNRAIADAISAASALDIPEAFSGRILAAIADLRKEN